jgi:hypothetical protein
MHVRPALDRDRQMRVIYSMKTGATDTGPVGSKPHMSAIILACRTIADEVNLALRKTAAPYPVYWIDSKLHIKPEKLRDAVQATIDRITNVETIILAFGLCGNGLAGIRSGTARLVLPRAADCISLLLGSEERRIGVMREGARYFLTKGWLESEHNIASELDYSVGKFGPERGLRVMKAMLKNYRYLSLIETGAYDIGPYVKRTETLAKRLGLGHEIIRGSQRFMEKLLTGPWDEEFIVARPGETIDRWDIGPCPQTEG